MYAKAYLKDHPEICKEVEMKVREQYKISTVEVAKDEKPEARPSRKKTVEIDDMEEMMVEPDFEDDMDISV